MGKMLMLIFFYYSRFPSIKAVWLVSSLTGQGIKSLKEKLVQAALDVPQVHQMIPKTHWIFKDEVNKVKAKKKRKNVSSTERFSVFKHSQPLTSAHPFFPLAKTESTNHVVEGASNTRINEMLYS